MTKSRDLRTTRQRITSRQRHLRAQICTHDVITYVTRGISRRRRRSHKFTRLAL